MSMRPKPPNLETVLLLLMSCAVFAVSISSIHLRLLHAACRSQPWEKHTNGNFQVMVLYGAALLALAILSYTYSRRGTTLRSQMVRHSREALWLLREEIIPSLRLCFASRRANTLLLLAVAIGAGLRGYFLAQPMRYDEAYTFLNFANKGLSDLFYYPLPNNHVLHTILVKGSTLIWGAHPASIRATAFLAGLGLVPFVFCLCRTLGQSGLFASVAAAVYPYLVSYSTNARGYSLLVFLTLALALVGAETTKKPSLGGAALFSAIAALGMMTMPSMLLPIVGIYCWLACLLFFRGHSLRTILLESAIPCGLMTTAFTMVLYTPVILVSNGVESIVANRFVQPLGWREFFSQLFPHLLSLRDFLRDMPWALSFFGVVLVIVGLYGSVRKRDWPALLLLPSVLLGSGIILLLVHSIPFARTWMYFIPLILITADSGFTYLIEKTLRRIRSFAAGLVFVAGSVVAVSLISTGTIAAYPDTGSFPEAPIIAGYLKPIVAEEDMVYVRRPADWPTYFYLWYYGVVDPYDEQDAESGRAFFVVKKSRYTIEDMTEKPVIKLLDFVDAALYRAVDQEDQ